MIYYRKHTRIPQSKLLRNYVSISVTAPRNISLDKAVRELEEVREVNRALDRKVKRLEKARGLQENCGDCGRITEIEAMSYEDWRSALFRYNTLKVLHARRIKQVNYYKDMHPTKEHKIKFVKEKGRDFSVEQEKIAVKLKKLFENL